MMGRAELFFSGSTSFANELYAENIGPAGTGISSFFSEIVKNAGISLEALSSHFYGRIEYILFFAFLFLVLGTAAEIRQIRPGIMAAGLVMLFLTAAVILLINSFIGYMPVRVITIPLFWLLIGIGAVCFAAQSV